MQVKNGVAYVWDTGASKSSIDKRVADELGLIPVGKGTISTANGVVAVNTYFVNLTRCAT